MGDQRLTLFLRWHHNLKKQLLIFETAIEK